MIICLLGFKQVGKSTVAKYLIEKYGFVEHNIKKALIEEIKEYFPYTLKVLSEMHEMTIDELFEHKPDGVRELMIDWGMFRRATNPYYWADKWDRSTPDGVNIVSDDTRFPEEYDVQDMVGAIFIRIVRPDIATGGDAPTETKSADLLADFTIKSIKGDHEGLYKSVDNIMSVLQ